MAYDKAGPSHSGTWLGSARGPREYVVGCGLGSSLTGPPSGSRVLLPAKSSRPLGAPRSPVSAIPTWGLQCSQLPRGWRRAP